MNKPLDSHRKDIKPKKSKKGLMIFFGVFTVLLIIFIFAMIDANGRASKIATSKTPKGVKVAVNRGASQVQNNRKIDNTSNESSPEALRANVQEEKEKEEAKKAGNSHVDSSKELETKARLIRQEKERKEASVVVEVEKKKAPVTKPKKKEKATVMTDEQIITKNMASLMSLDSYYPPEPIVADNLNRFVELKLKVKGVEQTAQIQQGELTAQNKYYQDKVIQRDLDKKENEEEKRQRELDFLELNPNYDEANDPNKVRIYNMGDLILGEITRPVNSDFNVDVYIDVAEPPLIGMRIKAKFELTDAQDGVLLRAVEYQYKDYIQSLDGYAVDIYTDSSPLFDNDVDSHFFTKFLARASFAFVAPFVSYLGDSKTSIIDGAVIVEKTGLSSTADKVVAGIAGVAEEFLPDLKKNASIPATVKIPANYPAGIIVSKPFYMPIGLFDDDESTNPDQSFYTTTENLEGSTYGRK